VIPVDGTIWISMNCKKGWVNARCNWRWPEVALIPFWADLAERQNFSRHDYLQFRAPLGFLPRRAHPPWERGEKAVRRSHTQTPAQGVSEYLAMPLEERVAFSSSKISRWSNF